MAVKTQKGEWDKPTADFSKPIWIPDGAYYDASLPMGFELFSRTLLNFTDGFKQGEPIVWADWQLDDLVRPMLGLRWSDTGRRVTRKVFFLAGRGNAKTTLAAAIGLFGLTAMDKNPEVDLFARSKEQADRMFKTIRAFVYAEPEFDKMMNVSVQVKKIHMLDGVGELVVRSGDAEAELGLNPTIALVDELLAQRNRDLWDAINTAFGKRPEGLLITMTTPSVNVETFAEEEYNNAKAISKNRELDPTYLPVIYEAGEDDDPFDRQTWLKANPGIESGFIDEQIIASEASAAQRDPTQLHSFKVYRCALWAQAGHGFLDMTQWDLGAGEMPSVEFLETLPCFMGLDMSATNDLTSVCLLWWDEKAEQAYAAWEHWTLEKIAAEMTKFTHGQWPVWLDADTTKVNVSNRSWVDHEDVAERVIELYDQFGPYGVGIDSYRARSLNKLLGPDGAGLPIQQLRTTGKSLQAGSEHFAKLVAGQAVRHNGDPIARWCASNATVKYDAENYPKVVKPDPNEQRTKIDAVVAACFAADRWLGWERDGGEHIPQGWLPPSMTMEYEETEAEPETLVLTRT